MQPRRKPVAAVVGGDGRKGGTEVPRRYKATAVLPAGFPPPLAHGPPAAYNPDGCRASADPAQVSPGGPMRSTAPAHGRITVLLIAALLATPEHLAAQQDNGGPDPFAALEWVNIGPNRGGRSIAVAGSDARPLEYY